MNLAPFTCTTCGITGQSLNFVSAQGRLVCARCAQPSAPRTRHSLADAPPLSSAEIEAIKVAMLQTGWTWGKH